MCPAYVSSLDQLPTSGCSPLFTVQTPRHWAQNRAAPGPQVGQAPGPQLALLLHPPSKGKASCTKWRGEAGGGALLFSTVSPSDCQAASESQGLSPGTPVRTWINAYSQAPLSNSESTGLG